MSTTETDTSKESNDVAGTPVGTAGKDPACGRGRWRRRLGVAGILVLVLVVCHGPLFRFLAGLLVVDDPLVETDAVVVMGSSGPFQAAPFGVAAALYRDGHVHEIVLIEDRSSRLAQLGVVPTLESVARPELSAAGVPKEAFTVLAGAYDSAGEAVGQLAAWLDEHPGTTVTVLCDEFASRRVSSFCRIVLGVERASRVRWRALPDRRYGVSNWWESRQGIVQFAGTYICLAHGCVFGESSETTERWNPDDYERKLGMAPDR